MWEPPRGFKHNNLGVFDELVSVGSLFEDDLGPYGELSGTHKAYVTHINSDFYFILSGRNFMGETLTSIPPFPSVPHHYHTRGEARSQQAGVSVRLPVAEPTVN